MSTNKYYTYSFHGQLQLNFDDINERFEGSKNPCYLLLLDWRKVNVLLALTQHFLTQYKTWGIDYKNQQAKWDEIEAWVNELEHCLMSGCDLEKLLTRFDNLNKLIIGSHLGLAVEITLPDDTSQTVDFSGKGIGTNLKILAEKNFGNSVTVQPATPAITVQPATPSITVQPATPDIDVSAIASELSYIRSSLAYSEGHLGNIRAEMGYINTALETLSEIQEYARGAIQQLANDFPVSLAYIRDSLVRSESYFDAIETKLSNLIAKFEVAFLSSDSLSLFTHLFNQLSPLLTPLSNLQTLKNDFQVAFLQSGQSYLQQMVMYLTKLNHLNAIDQWMLMLASKDCCQNGGTTTVTNPDGSTTTTPNPPPDILLDPTQPHDPRTNPIINKPYLPVITKTTTNSDGRCGFVWYWLNELANWIGWLFSLLSPLDWLWRLSGYMGVKTQIIENAVYVSGAGVVLKKLPSSSLGTLISEFFGLLGLVDLIGLAIPNLIREFADDFACGVNGQPSPNGTKEQLISALISYIPGHLNVSLDVASRIANYVGYIANLFYDYGLLDVASAYTGSIDMEDYAQYCPCPTVQANCANTTQLNGAISTNANYPVSVGEIITTTHSLSGLPAGVYICEVFTQYSNNSGNTWTNLWWCNRTPKTGPTGVGNQWHDGGYVSGSGTITITLHSWSPSGTSASMMRINGVKYANL